MYYDHEHKQKCWEGKFHHVYLVNFMSYTSVIYCYEHTTLDSLKTCKVFLPHTCGTLLGQYKDFQFAKEDY